MGQKLVFLMFFLYVYFLCGLFVVAPAVFVWPKTRGGACGSDVSIYKCISSIEEGLVFQTRCDFYLFKWPIHERQAADTDRRCKYQCNVRRARNRHDKLSIQHKNIQQAGNVYHAVSIMCYIGFRFRTFSTIRVYLAPAKVRGENIHSILLV